MRMQLAKKGLVVGAAVGLVIWLAAVPIHGQSDAAKPSALTTVNDTSDEQELVRLQQEWLRTETSRGDVARFMADKYALVTSEGTTITKAEMLRFVQSDEFPFTSMTAENLKVQVFGGAAVVKGLIKWSDKNHKSGQFLFTDTWLKRDGRWQCVATHESGAKETTVDSQALSPEQAVARNRATLSRYWKELVNQSDTSNAHEIISPEFRIYFGEEPEKLRGVEFFKGRRQELGKMFSKADLFEDQIIAQGNTIAVRWHGLAVHATEDCFGYKVKPGADFAYQGMAFYTFDASGLMTEARVIDNMFEVLELRRRQSEERSEVRK